MSANTPGPWTVDDTAPGAIRIRAEHAHTTIALMSRIDIGPRADDIAAALADAHLLAAGPRLRAALRNVVGAHDSLNAWWDTEGLSRHEGTGKTSADIRADVLDEARAVLDALDALTK